MLPIGSQLAGIQWALGAHIAVHIWYEGASQQSKEIYWTTANMPKQNADIQFAKNDYNGNSKNY
eukprot:4652484-Amphidinium_carterae.1